MSDWLSRQLAAAQEAYDGLPSWQQTAHQEKAMSDIADLREAVAKMTEGPWKAHRPRVRWRIVSTVHNWLVFDDGAGWHDQQDAAGVVALRNAAPALLDELEAARSEIAALRQKCEHAEADAIATEKAHRNLTEEVLRLHELCRGGTHRCVCNAVASMDTRWQQAEADLAALRQRHAEGNYSETPNSSPDDLLGTVKAKLDSSAGLLNRWTSEEVAALVTRCEQAEAEAARLRAYVLKASVAATEREEALTELSGVRQRHAEAVKTAYIEGRNSDEFDDADKFIEDEYSWLASEAKKGLT
jgi:predicted nuclease with TOPRIM domain